MNIKQLCICVSIDRGRTQLGSSNPVTEVRPLRQEASFLSVLCCVVLFLISSMFPASAAPRYLLLRGESTLRDTQDLTGAGATSLQPYPTVTIKKKC